MSAVLIVTWQVAPNAIDEYWDFMKTEKPILERHGANIRYFHNLGSGRDNLDPSSEFNRKPSEPIAVSIALEYEDVDAWRAGQDELNADPEFQALAAKWNERRSDLLVGETTGVLLSEIHFSQAG